MRVSQKVGRYLLFYETLTQPPLSGAFLYKRAPLKRIYKLINTMSRSLYKGPYVDEKLLKKIAGKKPGEGGVIKTWARGSVISPEMVGFTFGVHNGKEHVPVLVAEEMVGHKFGEFSPTKKFHRHGGKMQKELDQKKKEAEIAAAKAAKS